MRRQDLEQKWSKRMVAAAALLDRVEEAGVLKGLDDARLVEVRIKYGGVEETGVLLVIKAVAKGIQHVGFIGALTAVDALLTWAGKERGAGVKWREDRPWQGQ